MKTPRRFQTLSENLSYLDPNLLHRYAQVVKPGKNAPKGITRFVLLRLADFFSSSIVSTLTLGTTDASNMLH